MGRNSIFEKHKNYQNSEQFVAEDETDQIITHIQIDTISQVDYDLKSIELTFFKRSIFSKLRKFVQFEKISLGDNFLLDIF